jgi:NAD(P)H-hydrate epimerase
MAKAPATAMARPFADSAAGCLSPGAIKALMTASDKMDAVGIGPGLSLDPRTRELVGRFVRECPIPMVIDADALNALAALPDHGASVLRARKAPSILTPHPGEMGRLLGSSTAAVQNDRLAAVRTAADQFQCVVLLKGARTLIAAPDGRLAINQTGNPGMGSGGSGDVLTGISTTLLAQVPDPWQAASAAAFLHGLAGDLAAAEIGKAGLLATDLAEYLPRAMRHCGV